MLGRQQLESGCAECLSAFESFRWLQQAWPMLEVGCRLRLLRLAIRLGCLRLLWGTGLAQAEGVYTWRMSGLEALSLALGQCHKLESLTVREGECFVAGCLLRHFVKGARHGARRHLARR